jgi:hypothetical protein
MNSRRGTSRPLPNPHRRTQYPFSAEPVSSEEVDVAAADEVDEEAEDEAELDEAQAEAEAVLAAEAGGTGMTEARAEVRAPAGTAGYTQRAPRPGYDRRPQRGGRRGGGGGRRSRSNEQRNMPLITDLLKEGQEILVQIAKEPIGKKGARITSHIALPGRFLVYMPTVNHTGVSRKIASEEERQRLKRIIQSERENGHGGFIVRTAAMNAAEEDLRADIRFLKGLWTEIKSRADAGKGTDTDLSRPQRGRAGAARSGHLRLLRHLGGQRRGIRTHPALRQPLPARAGQASQALHQGNAALRTIRPERGNQQRL